ncbi:MAG: hypothetical protein QNK37_04200 [Acidobacteriota bacterium]|nr:hypothetical protein [Acidobacteriota bacterium]
MAGKLETTADRFRYFMEARGLDNKSFLAAVDGAVAPSTLFSILNGSRKPGKTLAVLIEKVWGFRAAYLLSSEGEMWTGSKRRKAPDLTEEEARVIAFMRSSIANARELESTMEKRELWSALYARTQRVLAVLEERARDRDAEDYEAYPRLCLMAFEESQRIAWEFGRYSRLFHQRKVHKLVTAFIERYLHELPLRTGAPSEEVIAGALAESLLNRRRKELALVEQSIANQRKTLENMCRLSLPHERLRGEGTNAARLRDLARSAEFLGQHDEEFQEALADLISDIKAELPEHPDLLTVCKEILANLDDQPELIPERGIEELEQSFES